VEEILTPIVQRCMDDSSRGETLNDNMLRWLIEENPPHFTNLPAILQGIMMINFGGLHTTLLVRHAPGMW
jgi:hypothetical protein